MRKEAGEQRRGVTESPRREGGKPRRGVSEAGDERERSGVRLPNGVIFLLVEVV